jgi:putative nucleotidyltransferase with HDIG domain
MIHFVQKLKELKSNKFVKIDKELIIVALLVAITGFIYLFVVNQRAFLNFFYLPVLLGAYFFGKRYGVFSALFSIILIFALAYFSPKTFDVHRTEAGVFRWFDIITWGSFLLITAYSVGLLYEKREALNNELRRTYQGIIEMLSLIIESADNFTQSHSYRVSAISELIAKEMKLNVLAVENIRIAALLHDLGKIGVSAEVLRKVTTLTAQDREFIKEHTQHAVDVLTPIGNKVTDLLPIILHHHEKYDGSGYYKTSLDDIPIGARIIAVADVYDALTTDRPYRKAFSPLQAEHEITSNSGTQFDPDVVRAFETILPYLEQEGPLFPSRRLEL